jgi:uncharacterized protein DUF4160
MPIISAFFGIVIRMYYKEHEPPHFHAEHGGQQAIFDFNGTHLAGELASRRAHRQIRKWAQLHRVALQANWARMKAGQPLESIAPLSEKKP